MRGSILRGAALGAMALATAVPAANAASIFKPPPKKQQYTYDSDKCTKQVDPLNVVFWGRAANADNVEKATEDVTGWGDGPVERGSTQYFLRTASSCDEKKAQSGSGTNVPHDRFHLRYFEKRINRTRWATYADAHHDDFGSENCRTGDATSSPDGFNQGRNRVLKEFRDDGARLRTIRWGNTTPFPQCNEKTAASDGRVGYIRVNKKR